MTMTKHSNLSVSYPPPSLYFYTHVSNYNSPSLNGMYLTRLGLFIGGCYLRKFYDIIKVSYLSTFMRLYECGYQHPDFTHQRIVWVYLYYVS